MICWLLGHKWEPWREWADIGMHRKCTRKWCTYVEIDTETVAWSGPFAALQQAARQRKAP